MVPGRVTEKRKGYPQQIGVQECELNYFSLVSEKNLTHRLGGFNITRNWQELR